MGTATVSVMPLRQRFHLTARRQTFSLAAVDVITMATAVFLWHPPAFALDILGLALLVIIRWRLGLYRARFHLSALDEFPRAIEAGFLAAGIYALFGLISQFNVTLPDIAWLAATGVALALLRVPLYVILRDLRRNDLARERMLLVGGGLVADAIAGKIDADKLDRSQLPEEYRKLSTADLKAEIEKQRAARGRLQSSLGELVVKRDAAVAAKRAEMPAGTDGFDAVVEEMITSQVK